MNDKLSAQIAEARRLAEDALAVYRPELHVGDNGVGEWVIPPEAQLAAAVLAMLPLVEAAERRMAEAVAAEREACARIASEHNVQYDSNAYAEWFRHAQSIARAIRARATPTGQGEGGAMDDIAEQFTEARQIADACREILDRYKIGMPCSFDGGKTFRPFSLPERVEIACMAATEGETQTKSAAQVPEATPYYRL